MADCMHLEVWQRRSNCWIGFIVVNWSQRIWDCAILTGENLKHGIQRSQMILCKISWCSFYLGAEMISVSYSLIKCLVAFLTFSYDYCMFWICCVPFEISQLLIVTSVMISILASIVAAMAESQTFGCLEFFGRKHDPWILQILGFDIDKGDESFGIWSQFSVEYNVTKISQLLCTTTIKWIKTLWKIGGMDITDAELCFVCFPQSCNHQDLLTRDALGSCHENVYAPRAVSFICDTHWLHSSVSVGTYIVAPTSGDNLFRYSPGIANVRVHTWVVRFKSYGYNTALPMPCKWKQYT